jgi:hypothetical protein
VLATLEKSVVYVTSETIEPLMISDDLPAQESLALISRRRSGKLRNVRSASDRRTGGIGLLPDPVRKHFEIVNRKRPGDHLPGSSANPCRYVIAPNGNELLHTPEKAGDGFNQRFDCDQHASQMWKSSAVRAHPPMDLFNEQVAWDMSAWVETNEPGLV